MATCNDVITGALVMLGQLRPGKVASGQAAEDGLEALKGIYQDVITSGSRGALTNVIATAAYTAGENERITDAGFMITKPTTILDEATDETRPVLDLAIVQVVGTNPGTWIFEANLGAWSRLDDIEAAGEAPLSTTRLLGLKARLALELADTYGSSPSAVVVRNAQKFQAWLARVPTDEPQAANPVYY
jgi:hypothetical protein